VQAAVFGSALSVGRLVGLASPWFCLWAVALVISFLGVLCRIRWASFVQQIIIVFTVSVFVLPYP